jgi:V8-like Glu-specific endopeptidase
MTRFDRILLSTLACAAFSAGAAGCATEPDRHVPVVEPEADGEIDPPPTKEAQLAEQKLRAEVVKDIDPEKWGWKKDGEAKFGTIDPVALDNRKPPLAKGIPEDKNHAVLVLADGRRYSQSVDSFLNPKLTIGRPAPDDNDPGDPVSVIGRAQIGNDQRVRTATDNYTKYPYRSVGTIMSNSTDKSGWCTATLIGPRLAITAGHCVYNDDTNTWSWNTWFSPGHRGRGSDRFPNGSPRAVVGLVSFHGWSVDEDPDHDVGFLILADEKRTASLGWFGFGHWAGSLDDLDVSMYQYPGSSYACAASPNANGTCGGYQYWGTGSFNDQCGNLLEHRIDTNPGSSGSPTYRWWDGGRWIVGPHAYGFSPCDDDDNKAVRLGSYKSGVACDLLEDFPSAYASHTCG